MTKMTKMAKMKSKMNKMAKMKRPRWQLSHILKPAAVVDNCRGCLAAQCTHTGCIGSPVICSSPSKNSYLCAKCAVSIVDAHTVLSQDDATSCC